MYDLSAWAPKSRSNQYQGRLYARPLPKSVYEQVRGLVKDYRWSQWARSLCEPS